MHIASWYPDNKLISSCLSYFSLISLFLFLSFSLSLSLFLSLSLCEYIYIYISGSRSQRVYGAWCRSVNVIIGQRALSNHLGLMSTVAKNCQSHGWVSVFAILTYICKQTDTVTHTTPHTHTHIYICIYIAVFTGQPILSRPCVGDHLGLSLLL